MWEIYDRLIDGVPKDIFVKDALMGLQWCLISCGGNGQKTSTGISMMVKEGKDCYSLTSKIEDMSLRELARYSKSWNFREASVGVAALNAYYNTLEKLEIYKPIYPESKNDDAFAAYKEEMAGKNVTVIGHFPGLNFYKEICNLTILERNPSDDDYPDSACEYILGEQDFIFITGTTITNKTLPRLLQLGRNAKVVMVGPSVVMSPILFDFGVDVLAGSIVADSENTAKITRQGGCTEIFRNGTKMVRIEK